jgi:hypothetical protein
MELLPSFKFKRLVHLVSFLSNALLNCKLVAVLKEADAVLAAYAPRLQAVLDGLAPVLRWIDEIVDGNPERRLIDRAINMIAAASNDLRGIRQDIHEAKQDLDSSKTNHLWLLGGGLILGGTPMPGIVR